MKKRNVIALVGAALVMGLVTGTVATGFAATSKPATTAGSAAAACGLRLGGAMRDAGGRLSDVVAKLTGLDADDVQASRTAGESFADIADAKGVSADAVVDEALKVREGVLAERVQSGAITQEQADAALAQMETRLTDRVNSTDAGCTGNGGMGGGRGGRGMGGGGCGMGGGAGACGGTCTQGTAVTQ